MQTATHPQTGETVVLVGDKWEKAERIASNPNGEKAYLVGGQWITKQGAAPAPAAPAAAAPTKPLKIGAEGLPDAVKAVWGDFNPLTQAAVGGKAAWDLAAMRLKQLTGGELTPDQVNEVRANRALLEDSPMAQLGNFAVNVGATGVPVAGAYKGLAGVAGNVLPKFLAPTAAAAATGAGLQTLTQPVLQGESGLEQAGTAAAISAGADAALRGTGRLIQPITQTPAVKALLEKDIVPTPGQAGGGFVKAMEERFSSIPGIGDLIRASQGRARTEFNRAELNLAMPKGEKATQIGKEGIENAQDALGAAYDRIFKGVPVKADSQLFASISAARNVPNIPLNEEGVKNFNSVVQKVLTERLPKGWQMDAADMKANVIGDLGKEAQQFLRSSTRAEQAVGEALMEARKNVQSWLLGKVGASSPGAAAKLAQLDPAYSTMKGLEKAVDRAAGQQGNFTPLQALRATRPNSEANNLARAAQEVMGSTTPNSGTTDRALAALLLGIGGAGAGANEYFGGPGYLSALALSPLLMSRTGSRYMVGDLIPGQQGAAAALRSLPPYLAPQFGNLMTQPDK